MTWNSIWNYRNTLSISTFLILHIILVLVIDVFQVICHFLLAWHQDPVVRLLCCFLGEFSQATNLENISLVFFLEVVIADVGVHFFFGVFDAGLVFHNYFILLRITAARIFTRQTLITNLWVAFFKIHITLIDISGETFVWNFFAEFAFGWDFWEVSFVDRILRCWCVRHGQVEILWEHLIRLSAELIFSWTQLVIALCVIIICRWNL